MTKEEIIEIQDTEYTLNRDINWWYLEGQLDVIKGDPLWNEWSNRKDPELIPLIEAYEMGYADAKGEQDDS